MTPSENNTKHTATGSIASLSAIRKDKIDKGYYYPRQAPCLWPIRQTKETPPTVT